MTLVMTMKITRNQLVRGDCVEVMRDHMDVDCIDMVMTSPPYDNLRDYLGYEFNYKRVFSWLYYKVKPGGVVCWNVADQTIDGGRTGTSFRHALFAQGIGFKIHDVIIWNKVGTPYTHPGRYSNCFEYVFVFSKGKPATRNILQRKNKYANTVKAQAYMTKHGERTPLEKQRVVKEHGPRTNIWRIPVGSYQNDKDALKHPAIFPEALAHDCIHSWSNPGDVVLDPMCGSGTTCKVAKQLGRDYIGIDVAQEYLDIAQKRIDKVLI